MKNILISLFLILTYTMSATDIHDNSKSGKRVVTCKIVDSEGTEITGAKIVIRETGETVFSDFSGNVKLEVDKSADYEVYVDMVGFAPKSISVKNLNHFDEVVLQQL